MKLLQALAQDRAEDLAFCPLVESSPQETISVVIGRMRDRRCGCALVTEAGKLRGIFTERDVLTRVLAKEFSQTEPISAVMTPDPVTLTPQDPVAEVIRRMHAGGYRHLPVIDSERNVLGVVSVKAVVCYLVEHFPAAVYNLPPDPAQRQSAREGA
ncbi:MAG TPA: CBS domain-containing protein [Phycisphaerae bacterium]|nr:CBS domain-containing protein [Phycisphaerae bacterium]